nr:response regulator [Myxococcus vastator]
MVEPRQATVLNVNDDDANRYLVNRLLSLAGYNVLEAATGMAALLLAQQHRPDVVILDVKLPDISGYEVCERLRAAPHTASMAVLHTSATFVSSDKKVRGLEGGADAYLTQPFEGAELIATVKSLLRLRHAEQVARQRAGGDGPPQGRVPGHAGARAAQPAGRHHDGHWHPGAQAHQR